MTNAKQTAETPEARLAAMGLSLPSPPTPVAAYIPFRISGNLVYIAGQIPLRDGKLLASGSVPDQVSMEAVLTCSRQCALNGIAVANAAIASLGLPNGLSHIKQIVRLGVFVACGPSFTDHPKVANGASELMVQVFGDRGRHARAAVGAPSLPLGAPVEVEFLFEFR